MNYKKYSALLICIIALSISACTRFPRVYKLDIEQGNKLSKESVSQLKLGMTRDEVLELFGTPTLNAIFQKDRWYYMYYRQPGYGKLEKNYLIIHFNNEGRVSEFSQDYFCP